MAQALIESAARSHPRGTPRGVLEGIFAELFSGFVYPQIWEDPEVDMAALGLGQASRVAAIASGGCNIMSYLTRAPARLVAVDLNPAHLALLDLKLAAARHLDGHAFRRLFRDAASLANVAAFDEILADRLAPASRRYWQSRTLAFRRRIDFFRTGLYRQGLLGRTIRLGHLICRLHGRDPRRLLEAESLEAQRRIFAEEVAPVLRGRAVDLLLRLPSSLFGLGIPPAQYEALMAEAPGRPAEVLEGRLSRLLADFPIDANYFARQALSLGYGEAVPPYLEPGHFATLKARAAGVERRHASMTAFLETQPAASFTAYVLLDAQDWMNEAQITQLWRAIDRTAVSGARVVFRTAGEASPLPAKLPADLLARWRHNEAEGRSLHTRDRAGIYGGFHIYQRVA